MWLLRLAVLARLVARCPAVGQPSDAEVLEKDAQVVEEVKHWHVRSVPGQPGMRYYFNDITREATYDIPKVWQDQKVHEQPGPFMPEDPEAERDLENPDPMSAAYKASYETAEQFEAERARHLSLAVQAPPHGGKVYRIRMKPGQVPPPKHVTPLRLRPQAAASLGGLPPPQWAPGPLQVFIPPPQPHDPAPSDPSDPRRHLAPITGVMYNGRLVSANDQLGLEAIYDHLVDPHGARPGAGRLGLVGARHRNTHKTVEAPHVERMQPPRHNDWVQPGPRPGVEEIWGPVVGPADESPGAEGGAAAGDDDDGGGGAL